MLSSNITIEDNDWDSVRQGHAALARDLERIFLSFGMGGNDFGGGVPKSANDQTVMQDGNYGFQAVTTDMLDALDESLRQAIDDAVADIPVVTYPISIANGGTGQSTRQAALNALSGAVTANRVLRGNGTDVTLAQIALATDVSGALPIANGGTGQTSASQSREALLGDTLINMANSYNSGSGTFTVPAGVYRMKALVVGAGGGGAGGTTSIQTIGYCSTTSGGPSNQAIECFGTGGGGGGGGIALVEFSVNPAQTISYSIGAGGNAGATGASGSSGGATSITLPSGTIVNCTGGEGGWQPGTSSVGHYGEGGRGGTPGVVETGGAFTLFASSANGSPGSIVVRTSSGISSGGHGIGGRGFNGATSYGYGGDGSASTGGGNAGGGGLVRFLYAV